MQRDISLQELLNQLSRQDQLFAYNVPASILASYEDGQLLAHLDATYSKPRVEICDPEQIQKFIAAGDRAIATRDYTNYAWTLKPGDEGVVKEVDGLSARVKFKKAGEIMLTGEIPLTVVGRKGRWSFATQYESAHQYNDVVNLRKGHVVKYVDPEIHSEEKTFNLPAGTEGMVVTHRVFNNGNGSGYFIIWANDPDVSVYPVEFYDTNAGTLHCAPGYLSKLGDFKLIKSLGVNYQALRQKLAR